MYNGHAKEQTIQARKSNQQVRQQVEKVAATKAEMQMFTKVTKTECDCLLSFFMTLDFC